jgi:hypothetical protein
LPGRAFVSSRRWEKLQPLLEKVGQAYHQSEAEIRTFVRFIEALSESSRPFHP